MTAAQYIQANHLDLKAYELEKLAMNSLTKVPHTYKYSECELDTLAMKHNFSCFVPSKRTMEYAHLYILRVFHDGVLTSYCKVGTSIDVHKRVKSLNKSWAKCGVSFEIHKISTEIPLAMDLEGCIHQVLKAKGLHHKPKCMQSGRSELFTYEIWIDDLIP